MGCPYLILGTAQIDTGYGVTRGAAKGQSTDPWPEILAAAERLGFAAVDTAVAYPGAHETIGRSSWAGPIHTKISSVENAVFEVSEAKKSLARTSLSVVYFHESSIGIDDPEALQQTARELLLHHQVDAVGVSVYSPTELSALLAIPEISVVQVPINPIDQRFLGRPLEEALAAGKRVIVRSIFLQGLLIADATESARNVPSQLELAVARFRDLCTRDSVGPMKACVDFAQSIRGIEGVIVGLEGLDQAQQLALLWSNFSPQSAHPELFSDISETDPLIVDPRNW